MYHRLWPLACGNASRCHDLHALIYNLIIGRSTGILLVSEHSLRPLVKPLITPADGGPIISATASHSLW